jgi:redox-sensitive bicupin YhaK (pirin superfamily)
VTESIELVLEPRTRDLGGLSVRRALPSAKRRLVGPFIFWDHIGPAALDPGRGLDVRPHPHIHLATVTYLFEGEIVHRDSLGCVQAIRPGDVNWMTAGRGIVHSERSPAQARATGVRLHGIQSWVALPRAEEDREPRFRHHPAEQLPVIERGGARLRLVAGRAFGEVSPVEVLSPLFYLDAAMPEGSRIEAPDEAPERAVYVAAGAIEIGGMRHAAGHLLLLAPGAAVELRAAAAARVLLFGGEPLDGARHLWWNFVSSSPERIEQARRDWREGRFPSVPGDAEFIPLPDE